MVGKKLNRSNTKMMGGKFKGEDTISRLPDEVIGMILSLLTIREATRTCLLSHRWERLWTLYNGSFIFDFAASYTRTRENHEHRRSKFIDSVNQILTSIHAGNINEFILRSYPDQVSKSHIDTWVAFAFERRVQKLDMDIKPFYCLGMSDSVPYTFPVELFHTLTISSLTSLRLKDLELNGELIEYFLSNCPLLEHLFVCMSHQLINLKVIGAAATFRLKCLEILFCYKIESLEVSAPNLVSFKYFGPRINLQFGNNHPKLLQLAVGKMDVENLVLSFSSYFTQIETLTLKFNVKDHREFTQCLKLTNVKHLTLITYACRDESLLGWTTLISSCPLLHKFTLEITTTPSSRKRELQNVMGHPHENLKVMEVVGFGGYPIDTELLMYLVASSTALEKIILNCCKPYIIGEGWDSFAATVGKNVVGRRRLQMLKKKLPPTVELVLLE